MFYGWQNDSGHFVYIYETNDTSKVVQRSICSGVVKCEGPMEVLINQARNKALIRSGSLKGMDQPLLSWLEHHPVHQKVPGSIPGQGTYT